MEELTVFEEQAQLVELMLQEDLLLRALDTHPILLLELFTIEFVIRISYHFTYL